MIVLTLKDIHCSATQLMAPEVWRFVVCGTEKAFLKTCD